VVEITPPASVFLFGYPHVRRMSTGVHDPLECAALYLRGSGGQALFLANDLIYVSRDFAEEVRTRIARRPACRSRGSWSLRRTRTPAR
jgi:neutral ceramidase